MFGGKRVDGPVARRFLAALATVLSVGIVATGCTPAPKSADEPAGGQATVVRIIDGDTIVADVSGSEETVRLLNIDTPETKHPDKPVECLGVEATSYLKSLLSPGDSITLEYDVERLDKYGRTLAGVYKDDSLVNADIAAAGLGVAVLFPPNERFYDEVKAAEAEAQKGGEGLFSPSIKCTVPAQAQKVIDDLDDLEQADPGTSAAAGTALAAVSAAVLAGKAKSATLKAMNAGKNGVQGAVWAATNGRYLPKMDSALDRVGTMETRLTKTRSDLARAEKAKRVAAVEAKKKAAAKRKAVAKQKAIAAENLAAKRRKAAAANRYVAPKQSYRAPAQTSKPKSSGNSSDGYTGRRCYLPGGKTYRRC